MNRKQSWDLLLKDLSRSVKYTIMGQSKFGETDMKKLLTFVELNPTELMKSNIHWDMTNTMKFHTSEKMHGGECQSPNLESTADQLIGDQYNLKY